jgi:hypothetical protein
LTRRKPLSSTFQRALCSVHAPIFPFRSSRTNSLVGRLQKGESITLPDGTTVHPNQCIGPATPGPVCLFPYFSMCRLIISLAGYPSGSLSHSGSHHRADHQPRMGGSQGTDHVRRCTLGMHRFVPLLSSLLVILEYFSAEALASAEYRSWMASFAPSAQHIIVNSQLNSQRIVFTGAGTLFFSCFVISRECFSARNHAKLHQLDGEVFALPWQTVSHDEKLFQSILSAFFGG